MTLLGFIAMQIILVVILTLASSNRFDRRDDQAEDDAVVVRLPYIYHLCTYMVLFLAALFAFGWIKEKLVIGLVVAIICSASAIYFETAYRRYRVIAYDNGIDIRYALRRRRFYSWDEITRIEITLKDQILFYSGERKILTIEPENNGYMDMLCFLQEKGVRIHVIDGKSMRKNAMHENEPIVIRPGFPYYLLFIMAAGVAVMSYWGLRRPAPPSDNPLADKYLPILIPLFILLIGIMSAVYYIIKSIELYDDRLVVHGFINSGTYMWEDITKALCKNELGFPIVVYCGGKRIFKIEMAYRGYEVLKKELLDRDLLEWKWEY